MLKSLLTKIPYFFVFLLFFSSLGQAYSEILTDPLQVYRDEIKQSETHAAQAILDTLKPTESDNTKNQERQTASPPFSETQIPDLNRSKTDKALTPKESSSENASPSSNKNPWLQPNPWAKNPSNIWEKKAKINPYANAPIPGPTSSKKNPSPPNIFLPSRRNNPSSLGPNQ